MTSSSLFFFFASFYQDYDKCLADVIEKTPSPVPKVFLFYCAEAYQTSYVLKEAKLCPGIKYDELKTIVLDSGGPYIFVSFPQKRNGIVFSSGVNYLHSDLQ